MTSSARSASTAAGLRFRTALRKGRVTSSLGAPAGQGKSGRADVGTSSARDSTSRLRPTSRASALVAAGRVRAPGGHGAAKRPRFAVT